jgi:hypothetical protein
LHSTNIGERLREKRRSLLHLGSWHKYRGYSYQQMSKIRGKSNSTNPKRAALVEKFGYDTKFAMHVVRLLLQIEEIMATGDLHLDRNSKLLQSVRNGEWTFERLEDWATEKEKALEQLYSNSKLPYKPDEEAVKTLLLECLEGHYGSLSAAVKIDKTVDQLVNELDIVLEKFRVTA